MRTIKPAAKVGADFPKVLQALLAQKALHVLPKEFGRFTPLARKTLCAVALALKGRRGDIGMIFVNNDYCVEDNFKYYQDFVAAGEKLGRANLFVYTLPTTPAAESAIYFGLTGPLFYLGGSKNFSFACAAAKRMVAAGEARGMVIIRQQGRTVYSYFVA